MGEQNEPNQSDDQETLDRTLDAVLTTKRPVSTTDEIADVTGESTEITRSTLTELHDQDRIERLEIPNSGVIWWAPRPLDDVLKSINAETILKRLSDELDTSISLGDGTVYENGDKHPPEELDSGSASQNETDSNEKDTGGVIPSSEESGEKRQQLKDGADLEDVSE
ncbi:hypothetical protein SAMN05421858_4631 [Haladaptatus litoreus]|uniref:Uncharacterized protein n=1 Tax=Haladaptatus litoreus TaxID=553468 RepID=A0A1N7EY77_9EURY|nr:hypothetical protein [Haladaptatus litoreus]SIR93073.1 hypothetical protein SAMN05421858_4631 [Haladaptatus litoreus]